MPETVCKKAPLKSQAVNRRPSFYNTRDGFIQVLLIAILPTIILALVGGCALLWHAQNHLALWFRLDACAVETMDHRIANLSILEKSNQQISVMQKIIYAARSAKPIPIVGQAATLSEQAALVAIRAIALVQQGVVLKAQASEPKFFLCSQDAFSTVPAHCVFPLFKTPLREKTPFADVPGTLLLNEAKSFTVQCLGRTSATAKLLRTRLFLKQESNLSYDYQE